MAAERGGEAPRGSRTVTANPAATRGVSGRTQGAERPEAAPKHPLDINGRTSDPPPMSAPEVCSFQLPEVCSFRLPLTLRMELHTGGRLRSECLGHSGRESFAVGAERTGTALRRLPRGGGFHLRHHRVPPRKPGFPDPSVASGPLHPTVLAAAGLLSEGTRDEVPPRSRVGGGRRDRAARARGPGSSLPAPCRASERMFFSGSRRPRPRPAVSARMGYSVPSARAAHPSTSHFRRVFCRRIGPYP